MSELLDKEVNTQRESLKNFWGSHKLLQAQKCAIKMKEKTKKNDVCVKMLLMEGSIL